MASHTSIPAAVLGLQGVVNVVFGVYGLVRPAELMNQMADQFGGSVPRPAAYTSSLQLLYMGILTFITASRPSLHRRVLTLRICVHLLTAYLFWEEGGKMKTLAMLDLGFAALNTITIPFVKDGGAH